MNIPKASMQAPRRLSLIRKLRNPVLLVLVLGSCGSLPTGAVPHGSQSGPTKPIRVLRPELLLAPTLLVAGLGFLGYTAYEYFFVNSRYSAQVESGLEELHAWHKKYEKQVQNHTKFIEKKLGRRKTSDLTEKKMDRDTFDENYSAEFATAGENDEVTQKIFENLPVDEKNKKLTQATRSLKGSLKEAMRKHNYSSCEGAIDKYQKDCKEALVFNQYTAIGGIVSIGLAVCCYIALPQRRA